MASIKKGPGSLRVGQLVCLTARLPSIFEVWLKCATIPRYSHMTHQLQQCVLPSVPQNAPLNLPGSPRRLMDNKPAGSTNPPFPQGNIPMPRIGRKCFLGKLLPCFSKDPNHPGMKVRNPLTRLSGAGPLWAVGVEVKSCSTSHGPFCAAELSCLCPLLLLSSWHPWIQPSPLSPLCVPDRLLDITSHPKLAAQLEKSPEAGASPTQAVLPLPPGAEVRAGRVGTVQAGTPLPAAGPTSLCPMVGRQLRYDPRSS